ncbi:MAG TPA: GNAT family N-acetyltransferase [Blastocatellia bacterium]|nr:GNAT family N-acetyltransferase [Blastocatellia bacterium]
MPPPLDVSLRPVVSSDEDFLYRLFCELRSRDFAGLGLDDAQLQSLLRMQYTAQSQSYRIQFGGDGHSIININGRAVGRLWVFRGEHDIELVDIALVDEERGNGVGRLLIEQLQAEASRTGKGIRLQVTTTNRAAALYQRLGFVITSEDGPYYTMQWSAS